MKVRDIENLPVILKTTAEIVGQANKAVIGDDYKLAYLLINSAGSGPGIISGDEFQLGEDAVLIADLDSIKSYAHGEESSIYDKKIGDAVFDSEGRELGAVSDLILNPADKQVYAVELTSGVLKDLWEGRSEIAIESVRWASTASGMIKEEGGKLR